MRVIFGVVSAHVCVRQKNHALHKKLDSSCIPCSQYKPVSGSAGELRGGRVWAGLPMRAELCGTVSWTCGCTAVRHRRAA